MNIYVTLSVLFLASCMGGSKEQKEQSHTRSVKSVVVSNYEMIDKNFVGLSIPEREVNLAFKVAGQILEIPVSKGELVESGVALAQLDPQDIELRLSADKSAYEQAKSSYERARRLLEHEAVSMQEVERAESAYKSSESNYKNTQDMLLHTTLRAPFRAVIERIDVAEFQRVQAGEMIMRIVSPTTTDVAFTLPEGLLNSMQDSLTRFIVSFDNYPGARFSASLLEYARTSSDASGFPVTLRVDNPNPSKYYINSGLSCTITMSIPKSNIGAVILPLSAIYAPTSGGTYVWIIDSQSRVELRSVKLGVPTGVDSVIVEDGLKSGDRVVTAGVYQLRSGQVVNIIK